MVYYNGTAGFQARRIQQFTFSVHTEAEVVGARQRARHIGALLGCDVQHQTRLATAVSEIVRNAFQYAGGGRIDFAIEGQTAGRYQLRRGRALRRTR